MKLEMKRAVAESADALNQARLDDRVVLTSVALGSPRATAAAVTSRTHSGRRRRNRGGGGGVAVAGAVATRKGDGDGSAERGAARGWTSMPCDASRAKVNRVAVEWRFASTRKTTLVLCTFVQATREKRTAAPIASFPAPPHAAFVASRAPSSRGLGPVAVFAVASTVALLGGVGRARLSRRASPHQHRNRRFPASASFAPSSGRGPPRDVSAARVRVMRAARFPRAEEEQTHRRHRVFPRIVGGALAR